LFQHINYHVVCTGLVDITQRGVPEGDVVLTSVFLQAEISYLSPSVCHPDELSIAVYNCQCLYVEMWTDEGIARIAAIAFSEAIVWRIKGSRLVVSACKESVNSVIMP